MARSPSPSSVDHRSAPSKRRRYDDDVDERDGLGASGSAAARHASSSRRDRPSTREYSPPIHGDSRGGSGGGRSRESGYGNGNGQDVGRNDGRDHDRSSTSRREYSRDDNRRRDDRSSRRDREHERDRSPRDERKSANPSGSGSGRRERERSFDRQRDDDGRGSSGNGRTDRSGRDEDRSRDRSPNERYSRSANDRDNSIPSSSYSMPVSLQQRSSSFMPISLASAPSTPISTNDAASPRSTPGTPRYGSPSVTDPNGGIGGAAISEEERLKAKREKVEAWKREREAKKAASASSTSTPIKPTITTPSTGLLAKPSSTSSLSATTTSSNSSSLSAGDQALAAAAAIASRLGPSSSSSSSLSRPSTTSSSLTRPSSSLPAKPSFSFATTSSASSNAFKPSALKNSLSFGAEEEVEKKVGMMRFEGEIDMSMDAESAQLDGDDEGDDEDLEGGASYKAREGGRDAYDTEMLNAADGDRMDVVEGSVDQEVEEEDDELDTFMSSVAAKVKTVDASDRARLGGPSESEAKKAVLFDPEAGETGMGEEIVESEDEIEKVGMGAEDILALAAKKVIRRGRELAKVDHSKIAYEAFRKAFYHAPPEVEALTAAEVDEMRLEMDDIKVRGADPPRPVSKWSYCGLPAACINVIKSLDYASPTSIQAQAVPAIMSGRDIIAVAKTGSGKTIAFILPMFRHIKDQRPLQSMEGPIAVIMTPTRELATQIYRECKPFLKALGLRASCAYGGMPLKDNIADLKRGAELVVCTPGRMIELLTTNSGRVVNLRRVTYLVLDEADRMFDMGFEPQVQKIINQIRPDRQTVLFSATFPKVMEALARKTLKRPLEITVGGRSIVAPEITQIVEVREEEHKFNRLLELLGRLMNDDKDARALIFVERQEGADNLLKELLKKNYSCMSLHGGMEQVDRDQTIADFKLGVVPVVIATSVAARGLDVKQLRLVIQYDAPNHMEDYVHRAGRTGRAGNKGTCVTFVTPEQDRYALEIYKALVNSGAEVSEELKALADGFAEKVKEGKASGSSGFGGKGLERFDQDRDAMSRAERAAYGEASGGDAETKTAEAAIEGGPPVVATNATTASLVESLEVEIKRGPAPQDIKKGPAAPAPAVSDIVVPALAAQGDEIGLTRAQSVIANFNAILKAKQTAGRERPEIDLSTDSARRRDPDATDFHAIIYINDYPQKARWKVTNKETMVQLVETTGASITNKGTFYEPGKEPGPEDLPKLHFLIESNDEFRVKHAISEIKKSLIEGALMALQAEQNASGGAGGSGGASTGRYSVL